MTWFQSKPIDTPVLVVDALGLSYRIQESNGEGLELIADQLDQQLYSFRAKVPHRLMIVTSTKVWGSKEFCSVRFNDMFILFSKRKMQNPELSYLVASILLHQQLLLAGFMVRGGLGAGLVLHKEDLLLGNGFLDAYAVAEKRVGGTRNICAIQLSKSFISRLPRTERAWRLICSYKGHFFLNPRAIIDPELEVFDNARISSLLVAAGINAEKLQATKAFLEGFIDYDSAIRQGGFPT